MDEEKWVKYHYIITVQYPVKGRMHTETWSNPEDFRADQTDSEIFAEILESIARHKDDFPDDPAVLFYRLAKEEIS